MLNINTFRFEHTQFHLNRNAGPLTFCRLAQLIVCNRKLSTLQLEKTPFLLVNCSNSQTALENFNSKIFQSNQPRQKKTIAIDTRVWIAVRLDAYSTLARWILHVRLNLPAVMVRARERAPRFSRTVLGASRANKERKRKADRGGNALALATVGWYTQQASTSQELHQ